MVIHSIKSMHAKSKSKKPKKSLIDRRAIRQPKLKAIKEHTFAGNKYKIAWEKPTDWKDDQGRPVELTGLCDPPDEPGKTIMIDPDVDELVFLKTIVDEGIHACDFSIDNDYVDRMSETIGEFLWRVGFRLKK